MAKKTVQSDTELLKILVNKRCHDLRTQGQLADQAIFDLTWSMGQLKVLREDRPDLFDDNANMHLEIAIETLALKATKLRDANREIRKGYRRLRRES